MSKQENINKFETYCTFAGTATLIILILLSPWLRNMSYKMQAVPFAVSLVLLGLPHGAMDHLVPSKLSNIPKTRGIATVSAAYLFIGGFYALTWVFYPVISAGFFVIMTWLHWGLGDLYTIRRFYKNNTYDYKISAALSAVLRGAIPMLVPLIYYPKIYTAFLKSMESLFTSKTFNYTILTSTQVKTVVALLIIILSTLLITYTYYKTQKIPWYSILEILVLFIFFTSLPPIFAVGVYFCTWHSLRHLCRLSLLPGDSRKAVSTKQVTRYMSDMIKNTLPLTILSIAGLAASAFILNARNPQNLLALYLVFISILTLPHTLIVIWMDKIQYNE